MNFDDKGNTQNGNGEQKFCWVRNGRWFLYRINNSIG